MRLVSLFETSRNNISIKEGVHSNKDTFRRYGQKQQGTTALVVWSIERDDDVDDD